MKSGKISTDNYSNRLHDLQERFQNLEPNLEDSDTKRALSVLYGMVQEVLRNINKLSVGQESGGVSIKDIAGMYRNAPKMEGPAMNTPLPAGTKAPDFSLTDTFGINVNLSDYRGSTVMLVFYPLDWSPGCSQQLDLYQQEWNEFEKRDIKVIGISVDSIYSHGAWAAVRNIKFPLLSDFDPKGEVAMKYQVYRESDGFSERALYIIDEMGIVRYSHVSPFIHHIPDIYELIKKLDEISNPVTV